MFVNLIAKQRVVYALLFSALTYGGSAWSQSVPTDAAGGCPISPAIVASFFESGSPSLNGVVKPADSTVSLAPNCGFFQWTEQMFLWLTSPAPATYGGGSHIMFSPQFFTVTPEDANGRRTFLVNTPGKPLRMGLRPTELGPHGLPIVMARTGQVVEVAPEQPGQKPPGIRIGGRIVSVTEIAAAQKTKLGNLALFDARGLLLKPTMLKLTPIARPRALLTNGQSLPIVTTKSFVTSIQARKVMISNLPIFIDSAGNIIDVEPGQADGSVLLSQKGSLIYYITVVNDVFAYHRSMQGAAVIPSNTTLKFPLSASDVAPVVSFAASRGHAIKDPNALAIESKSSWVDSGTVPNPNDYIEVSAVVPTYDRSDPNNWKPNGEATVKVVMLGLHVVGSTNGHGEMVWGTFEHLGNAPDATYAYNSTSGLKTVLQNTNGSWLFTPNGSTGPFNSTSNSVSGGVISGSPVGSAAILRAKPWGSNDGGNPANAAALNTQVISANSSVISQLDPADVRKSYFQLGTTWTIGGTPPSGGNEVGTNHLANATLETFVQGDSPSEASSNCFVCHRTNTVIVSHVYDVLTPLP